MTSKRLTEPATGQRVPVRLLVHFQTGRVPFVQVTDGVRAVDGINLHGAGTRAVDVSEGGRQVELRDPVTGRGTGARISIADALAVLAALAYE